MAGPWYVDHPGWQAHPGSPERRALDREMLEHPDRWPMADRLPLKRWLPDGTVETGGLTYADRPLSVYHRNGATAYRDLDELLDAGWTVD